MLSPNVLRTHITEFSRSTVRPRWEPMEYLVPGCDGSRNPGNGHYVLAKLNREIREVCIFEGRDYVFYFAPHRSLEALHILKIIP